MKFKFGEQRKSRIISFNRVLPEIIEEYDLEKSFTIEILVSKWRSIVGDIISTHSKPDRIFKKILFIAVDHSVYANEIIMMIDIILKRLKEEIPNSPVERIKVEVKNITW